MTESGITMESTVRGEEMFTHTVATKTSVAERSFSLYDSVELGVKPMPQPLLHRGRQLQHKTYKTQGLKNFKVPAGIHNDQQFFSQV